MQAEIEKAKARIAEIDRVQAYEQQVEEMEDLKSTRNVLHSLPAIFLKCSVLHCNDDGLVCNNGYNGQPPLSEEIWYIK